MNLISVPGKVWNASENNTSINKNFFRKVVVYLLHIFHWMKINAEYKVIVPVFTDRLWCSRSWKVGSMCRTTPHSPPRTLSSWFLSGRPMVPGAHISGRKASLLTELRGWSRTPGRREREAPRVCRCCLQSTRRSPTVPRQGLAPSVCISRSRLVLQRANEIVFSFHQWKLPIMKARCFFVHSIS